MDDAVVSGLVLVVLLVGLAGTLIPILPGILLMWAATVGYGFAVGFGGVAIVVIAITTVLSIVAVALGFALPKRAADASGASSQSQWFAALGAVIGFFVIPVVGVVIGALVGIAASEYGRTNDWEMTKRSTIGVAKGFGISALAQFVIGFLMLLVWLPWGAINAF